MTADDRDVDHKHLRLLLLREAAERKAAAGAALQGTRFKKRAERDWEEADKATAVKPFATPTTSAPTKINRAAIAKALAKAAADLDRPSPSTSQTVPPVEADTIAEKSDDSEEYEDIWLQGETTVPTSPEAPEATIRVTVPAPSPRSPAESSGVTRTGSVATNWLQRVGEIADYREGHWLKPLSAHKDRHNLVGNLRHFLGRTLPEDFGIDGTPTVHVAQFQHVLTYLVLELSIVRGLAFEVQPACVLPNHFGLHAQLTAEIRQLSNLLREDRVLQPPPAVESVLRKAESLAGKLWECKTHLVQLVNRLTRDPAVPKI